LRCSRAPINAIPKAKPIVASVSRLPMLSPHDQRGTAERPRRYLRIEHRATLPPIHSAPITAQMASGAPSRGPRSEQEIRPPTIQPTSEVPARRPASRPASPQRMAARNIGTVKASAESP